MSQTLFLPSNDSSLPQFHPAAFTHYEYTPHQLAQYLAHSQPEPEHVVNVEASQADIMLAPILAPLSSHHHFSAYNRVKHGQSGAPSHYTPLSIQLPTHVNSLRKKQARFSTAQIFYPLSRGHAAVEPSGPDSERIVSAIPPILSYWETPMVEDVPVSPLIATLNHVHISDPTTLALTGHHLAQNISRSFPTVQPPPSESLEKALYMAISSKITTTLPSIALGVSGNSTTPKTSHSHPINIAAILPPEMISFLTSKLKPNSSRWNMMYSLHEELVLQQLMMNGSSSYSLAPDQASQPSDHLVVEDAASTICHLRDDLRRDPSMSTHSRKVRRPPDLSSVGSRASRRTSALQKIAMSTSSEIRLHALPRASLGNLLLSSCPGKKVRLDGNDQAGRSAICRDLDVDLARIKGLGVRCVVCCLDDEELQFLGAPWEAYHACASSLGLDVIRLPIPEGLGPLEVHALDALLGRVIHDYTLRGTNVLVHCRGGVGRAGVIACCWMLKLGLCGNIHSAPPSARGYVRQDNLALVESAVRVVRMRRSLKAIETYEQVKFLVEYVEHLRPPFMS